MMAKSIGIDFNQTTNVNKVKIAVRLRVIRFVVKRERAQTAR